MVFFAHRLLMAVDKYPGYQQDGIIGHSINQVVNNEIAGYLQLSYPPTV